MTKGLSVSMQQSIGAKSNSKQNWPISTVKKNKLVERIPNIKIIKDKCNTFNYFLSERFIRLGF